MVVQPGWCAWVTDTAAPCWSWTSSGAGRSGRSERRTAGNSSLRVLKPPGTSPPMTRSRGAASPDTSTASEPSLRATCPACPPTAGRSRAAVVGAVDGSRRRPGRRPRVAPRRGRRRLPGQRDAERRGRRVRAPSGLHPDQPRDRRPAGAVGRARPARSTARQGQAAGGQREPAWRVTASSLTDDSAAASSRTSPAGRTAWLSTILPRRLGEGLHRLARPISCGSACGSTMVASRTAPRSGTSRSNRRRGTSTTWPSASGGTPAGGSRGGNIVVVDELHGARSGADVR